MRKKGARKRTDRFRQLRLLIMVGVLFTMGLIFLVSTLGRQEFGPLHKLVLETSGPLLKVTSQVGSFFGGIKENYLDFVRQRIDYEKLRQRLIEAETESYKYREALATNTRLRKLLEFKENSSLPVVGASIVGKDPSLWFRTVVIDRGENDGVLKGMPVVSSEGIVGQILRVSPGYAKVLLAIAPSSAIDVLLQKSRVRGILKGDGSMTYRLEYILKTVEVQEGDHVVTAGYGGLFPPGLPVGVVSKVLKKRRGMFQEIEVKPAVDFLRLENLLVIQQQHPFKEGE